MKYMFGQCIHDTGIIGGVLLPEDKVERWRGQMSTPYSELSEQEKESDREQADKVLNVLKEFAI